MRVPRFRPLSVKGFAVAVRTVQQHAHKPYNVQQQQQQQRYARTVRMHAEYCTRLDFKGRYNNISPR
jgi:hypothetical protein